MRLISKSIWYFIVISIPVFIGAGIFAYYSIAEAVDENIKESLWNDKTKAEQLIDSKLIPDLMILSFDSLSAIKRVKTGNSGYEFLNISRSQPNEDELLNYKALVSYRKKGDKNYMITVTHPILEEEDLIENLVSTMLVMFTLLLMIFLVANYFLSRSLWRPFNSTLAALSVFNLPEGKPLRIEKTTTAEFKKLNEVISEMTQKMLNDFKFQKEFTENASHEMQTPLAVIKARLEQLMQCPRLQSEELLQVHSIEMAVNKLTSLNKSLLLLAKIENKQFHESSANSINDGLKRVLADWEDFITEKKIEIKLLETEEANILMNPVLFDIMLNNFIQNAVKHNVIGGSIEIRSHKGQLTISNTGETSGLDAKSIFNRFAKNKDKTDSTGLGLAIVQSIAFNYGFKISYQFKGGLHVFELNY